MLIRNKDLLELVNRQVAKIGHSAPVDQFYEGFSKLKIKEKNALKTRPFSSSLAQDKKLYSIMGQVPWTNSATLKPNKHLEAKKIVLRCNKQSRSWHCGRKTVSLTKTVIAEESKEPPLFFNSFLNQKITQSFKEKQKKLRKYCLNTYKKKDQGEKERHAEIIGEKKRNNKSLKKGRSIYRYSFGSKQKLFIRQTLR